MGVDQLLFVRPEGDGASGMPATRASGRCRELAGRVIARRTPGDHAARWSRAGVWLHGDLRGGAADRPARDHRRRLGRRLRRRRAGRQRAAGASCTASANPARGWLAVAPHRRVGRAAGRAHRPPQRRQGRGPALRRHPGPGDRLAGRAHVPPRLPDPGRGAVVRLAAGAGRDAPGGRALVRRLGGARRRRHRRLGGRPVLRGGRRLAAGPVHRRPGQPRRVEGPRAVALHPPPELLRRRLRVVGAVPGDGVDVDGARCSCSRRC